MQIILMLEISEWRNSSSIKNKKNIKKKNSFVVPTNQTKQDIFAFYKKFCLTDFSDFFFYEQFSLPTKQNRELLCYAARLHENKAKFSK